MDHSYRFRRLRQQASLRNLVRETCLRMENLIWPIFVEESLRQQVPIETMPGVVRYPEHELAEQVQRAWGLGIRAVILFGVSHRKDEEGTDTWDTDGLMARMIRSAKAAVPEMVVISDNCFCEYTTHGHCGVVQHGLVDNDATLENLKRQVVVAAEAGADMIAPSGMMDGMVTAIREALDHAGFTDLPVMSYSSKFASAFYGPFRDAVNSTFKGDRNGYQIDYGNAREALAESLEDERQGADILMVKPGIAYLDILTRIRQQTHRPLAVYQVSGEYGMIKAAAAAGIIDERQLVLESLTAFRRAGADLIISYFAPQVSSWLAER